MRSQNSVWTAAPSSGFMQARIRMRLADGRELERIAQSDSWEMSDGGHLSLCPRGKDFRRFDAQGNLMWKQGVAPGDDLRHSAVTQDTLYLQGYGYWNSADLEDGRGAHDRADNIWRDVFASRDGRLVTVENGKLMVRGPDLELVVDKKLPIKHNWVVHHPEARMLTLTWDEHKEGEPKRHAVIDESGRTLFRSKQELVFQGSDADGELWQLLHDGERFNALHVGPEGARLHPLEHPSIAVFGTPEGFAALAVVEDKPVVLDQAGTLHALPEGKLDELYSLPDGSVLIAQERTLSRFRAGRVETVYTSGTDFLAGQLQDGSFVVVTSEATLHLDPQGQEKARFSDAWAARVALGQEIVSTRAIFKRGLERAVRPGWGDLLPAVERFAGPPKSAPAGSSRATSSRLDFVRSPSAESWARAGMSSAVKLAGTDILACATLVMAGGKVDLMTAAAHPDGRVEVFNTWTAMDSDQLPAAPTELHIDERGVVARDQAGNLLQLEFEGKQPVADRPDAREVGDLVRRMAEHRWEARNSLPGALELARAYPALREAAEFATEAWEFHPDLGASAAKEAFQHPNRGKLVWMRQLLAQNLNVPILGFLKRRDPVAETAIELAVRSKMDRYHGERLVSQGLDENRPKIAGSPLVKRLLALDWLSQKEPLRADRVPIYLDLLSEAARDDLERQAVDGRKADWEAGSKHSPETWWRATVFELQGLGEVREAVEKLADRSTATVEDRGTRVIVGGAVIRKAR